MKINHATPVFFVRDARKAKDFYVDVLGMTVTANFGDLNFTFKEGFALWQPLDDNIIPSRLGMENIHNREAVSRFEFCFETSDLDSDFEALKAYGVKFLH